MQCRRTSWAPGPYRWTFTDWYRRRTRSGSPFAGRKGPEETAVRVEDETQLRARTHQHHRSSSTYVGLWPGRSSSYPGGGGCPFFTLAGRAHSLPGYQRTGPAHPDEDPAQHRHGTSAPDVARFRRTGRGDVEASADVSKSCDVRPGRQLSCRARILSSRSSIHPIMTGEAAATRGARPQMALGGPSACRARREMTCHPDAGPDPDVVIEAPTGGTRRRRPAGEGARVRLVHPSGAQVGGPTDEETTTATARSCWGGCVSESRTEAWIAPPALPSGPQTRVVLARVPRPVSPADGHTGGQLA